MKQKLLILFMVIVFSLSALSLAFPGRAFADNRLTLKQIKDVELTWITRAKIKADFGKGENGDADVLYFFDRDIGDGTRNYQVTDPYASATNCFGEIDVSEDFRRGTMDLDFIRPGAEGVGCSETDPGEIERPISGRKEINVVYALSDNESTIERIDKGGATFTQSGKTNLYLNGDDDDGCQDRIILDLDKVEPANSRFRLYILINGRSNPTLNSKLPELNAPGCQIPTNFGDVLGAIGLYVVAPSTLSKKNWHPISTEDNAKDPNARTTTTTSSAFGGGGGNGEDGVTCESSGGALSWIFCPVIEGLANASDGIYNSIIKPLLETPGVDVSEKSTTRQVWDQMRLYGNIILVIGMLVIVFGQAIGGGLVDAYTAKKVLPRILIAAILLNLSIYIVAVVVDITNLLGRSLNDLIISPFEAIGQAHFKIGDAVAGIGITGILIGAGGTGLLIAAGGLGIIIQFLLLFILLPALIAFIGIMGTLILRMGIIQFLIIVSPIAFAFYCLPNTEKYFKQWWNLLFKTAMVYPIVAVIFAMTDVLVLTIGQANTGILGDVVKIVVLIIPLFLIPFAFKLSGGAMGAIYGAINNASAPTSGRLKKFRQERGARGRERIGRQVLQKRADWQNRLQTRASRDGRSGLSKFGLGVIARGVGGYNIQAADAARRAAVGEEINKQIATGRDDEIRGLAVDKSTAASRVRDGVTQYQTLGGGWVGEAAVDEGQRRWGKDTYAQQAALSYEMRKASTTEDVRRIASGYHSVAKNAWGMTDNEAAGSWIGAAFENQNQHLEYKYTRWQDGSMSAEQAANFATETYEKKGSYPLAQMHGDTIARLQEAYDIAGTAGDTATQDRLKGVAETFMTRYGAAGGRVAGMEGEVPITATGPPVAGVQQEVHQTNTPGAAAVAEQVRGFAEHVGVYRPLSPTTDTHSAGPAPTTPRQN